MILDALVRADRYRALHPLFGTAFDWLASPACAQAPEGRSAICGEDLQVIIQHADSISGEGRQLESHRRYIDIQVNLAGGESMEWHPSTGLALAQEYVEETDFCLYRQPATVTRLIVEPGHFAIFYPEDAHKPSCPLGAAPQRMHKVVFKVALAAAARSSNRGG